MKLNILNLILLELNYYSKKVIQIQFSKFKC